MDRKFDPENSDRAAGFMKFRYSGGDTVIQWFDRQALNPWDMLRRYTTGWNYVSKSNAERFRFANATVVALPEAEGCKVDVRMEYHAFTVPGLFGNKGWYVYQTNYVFEDEILDAVEKDVGK